MTLISCKKMLQKLSLTFPAFILGAGLILPVTTLEAGPVPGVENIEKDPVDFSTPESLEVWDIGNEDFLVTFRWKPEQEFSEHAVVGTFNSWDAGDLPMEGPDEEGYHTVTARIPTGEYAYKFLGDDEEYFTDPLNPKTVANTPGDSELLLGFYAFLADVNPKVGDGEIAEMGLRHDPENYTFFDPFTTSRGILRYQTVSQDVEEVYIEFGDEKSLDDGEIHLMQSAGSDGKFDFFEYPVTDLYKQKYSHYRFRVIDGDNTFVSSPFAFEDISFDPIDTPEWAKHAIWYQIMVDRFRDGDPLNNPEYLDGATGRIDVTHPWISEWYDEKEYERRDGKTFWVWSMYDRLYGGDFQGLIDKLDYIQDLGVTAIYLNPVFEASNSHKYNASSFIHADDGYGVAGEFAKSYPLEDETDPSTWTFNESDKMLLKLIDEVHARGMRIIFDGVFNHVGDLHPAFQDVKENGEDSKYADWFKIISYDPFEYEGWAGFDGLPEFAQANGKYASESLKTHVWGITERWMDPNGDGDPSDGIDGWRLDVPMELPLSFWADWRKHVKSINPDAYIVGEVWNPAEDWLDGTTMDAVMNYQVPITVNPFFINKEQKITATELDRRLARLRLRYPRNHTYVLQNLFDSHDTDRWVSQIANPDRAYDTENRIQDEGVEYFDERPLPEHYDKLKLMMIFQATYIGAPMIWYGTEVGMFGADDPRTRMPMWWEDLMPYESPDYIIMDDLREHVRSLFHLRNATPELRVGEFATVVTLDDQDVYGYYRYQLDSTQAILVLLNNSTSSQSFEVTADPEVTPEGFKDTVQLFGDAEISVSSDKLKVTLEPVSGTIIRVIR